MGIRPRVVFVFRNAIKRRGDATPVVPQGTAAKWTRRISPFLAVTMLVGIMLAPPSQALDGFESNDGNLEPAGAVDWNSFENDYTKIVTATGAITSDISSPVGGSFDSLTWVQDRTGNPDDIFGGGTKQDENCPGTTIGSLGGGNSKFDIDRLYLTHAKDGTDDYLFVSWVRVPQNSTTASAHIAYEFNSGDTLCTTGQNGGPALISRTSGDRLLVYDFEGGSGTSTSPSLKLLTWLAPSDGLTGDCEVASVRPCWGDVKSLNDTISDGAVNTTSIGEVTDSIPATTETLGVVRFGEAGINLTDLDIDICDFSGTVTGVARSSGNSGTASMKDKAGPAEFTLPGCVQDTTITTTVSLDDHATLNGFDSVFVGDHTGTLTFTLYGPTDTDCDGDIDSGPDAGDPVDPVYETTISDIDSGGPWSTADGDNSESSYVVPHTAADQGIYNWVVTYSGDSANNPSTSDCGDESVDVEYGL